MSNPHSKEPTTRHTQPSVKQSEVDIQQRRYLGNKHTLVEFIREIVETKIGDFRSLGDPFAGTGAVAAEFNERDKKVILGENLYTNYIPLTAWFSDQEVRDKYITATLKKLQNIKPSKQNYASEKFGGKYFSHEDARKIGAIREHIKHLECAFREKSILLSSLLYAFDRIAHTCGHYDSFRNSQPETKGVTLRKPNYFRADTNSGNKVFCADANKLVREIDVDVLYLDPPYNSRQYCDLYHVPENILRWDKPPVKGKANKFDRSQLKSEYSLKGASEVFEDLITHSKAKYIILSYNNMGEKGHSRSNARISDNKIKNVLSDKGSLEVFERDYKNFNAGKREQGIKNHKERLFVCEVDK